MNIINAQSRWADLPILTNGERLAILRAEEKSIMNYLTFIESCIRDVKEEMTQGGRGV